MLTEVHSVAPLIAGRGLQGIGRGPASSTAAAFIVDSAPPSPSWLASAVTTGSPMAGLTLGALGSGALAQYGPAPAPWSTSSRRAFSFACAMLILAARETVARQAGAVAGRSAIYLISYGGAAIPGLIAGQLTRSLSLFDVALGYGAAAALACAITLVAAREPRSTAPAEQPAII